MQTLAAYSMFLLIIVAVGLAIIASVFIILAGYEGMAWMKSRPEFQLWQRTVAKALVRAGTRVENEFGILCRAIHLQAPLVQSSCERSPIPARRKPRESDTQ